jgi:predicted TIM-barrel fold metal-dependent hydrolase
MVIASSCLEETSMTATVPATASAAIRSSLDHPVLDADCHTIEYLPALSEHLREAGVALDLDGSTPGGLFLNAAMGFSTDDRIELRSWARMTPAERKRWRPTIAPWWAYPSRDARVVATIKFPGVLHERLAEFGIDFAVVYPTLGLGFTHIDDDDTRVPACRALNSYLRDAFAPFADRLRPVALVPTSTPEEAVAELEHAVAQGFRVILIPNFNRRPVPGAVERDPALAHWAHYLDTYGVDSDYDYDPFWRRCVELRVAVTSHSASMGRPHRRSPSNYMFNSTGSFAEANHDLCKSLFLGGVTRRFPELRVGLLEGGVAWACSLYSDLLSRWSKRNRVAIHNYDPANTDPVAFAEYAARYAPRRGAEQMEALDVRGAAAGAVDDGFHDDWAALDVDDAEELARLFVSSFYFGCEADDPMTTTAFRRDVNPFGARLNTLFGSDIGHWDVPDLTGVLAEAWEPVERGWITEADFRDFVFANQARFYLESDPGFFEGTAVEAGVAAAL